MSIRGFMNENQSVVVVVAIIFIGAAGYFIYRNTFGGGGVGTVGTAWYYDTVTKDYFKGDASAFPPIDSPDGNPAVRAHFYTCGDCGESDRFVGFYERYEPSVKARLEKAQAAAAEGNEEAMMDMYAIEGQGLQYSSDGERWYSSHSPQAEAIFSDSKMTCPDGKRATYCRAK